MTRPVAPSGIYALKDDIYAEDGICTEMTSSEIVQGRNMTGEVETPLGSTPDAHKDNWLFSYFNRHIIYLTEMVEYLEELIPSA